jgi:hypothetical protein
MNIKGFIITAIIALVVVAIASRVAPIKKIVFGG